MQTTPFEGISFDALLPAEMARRAEEKRAFGRPLGQQPAAAATAARPRPG